MAAAIATLPGFREGKQFLRPNALVLFQPVLDNNPNDGYGYERVKENYKNYSPAHHVTSEVPPTILYGGTTDTAAKLPALRRFRDNMKAAGNKCILLEFEGKHGFINKPDIRPKILKAADEFLMDLGFLGD